MEGINSRGQARLIQQCDDWRFIQPDSIIEDWYNLRYLNRYAYGWDYPVRYTKPTGNRVCEDVVSNNVHNFAGVQCFSMRCK